MVNFEDVLEKERQAYRVLFTYLGIDPSDVFAEDIYLKQRFDLVADEVYYVLSFKVFTRDYAERAYTPAYDRTRIDISLRVPFDTIEEWREEFGL